MRTKLLYSLAFILLAFSVSAFMPSNKGSDQELTPSLLKSGIKIIDIRTEPEWKQTGIVKGAYTLTFFDEKGGYDAKGFVHKLSSIVSADEPFALICRTGNRTSKVAKFLREVGFKKVINLEGGVVEAAKNGIKLEPYRK